MGPLSWLKNLVSTFFGAPGSKKKELSAPAKALLEPGLAIDFKLDETWQRLHTRTPELNTSALTGPITPLRGIAPNWSIVLRAGCKTGRRVPEHLILR